MITPVPGPVLPPAVGDQLVPGNGHCHWSGKSSRAGGVRVIQVDAGLIGE